MKSLKYLKYVLRHKWFVFLGCLKLGWGNSFFIPLLWLGIFHDWSKFRFSEWGPYVNYFYGGECSEMTKQWRKLLFNTAWLHHQNRNKHHWQYWMLQNDQDGAELIDMPDLYILEMAADWYGAGRAITGREKIGPWYIENQDKIQISYRTRKILEDVIENFDNRR